MYTWSFNSGELFQVTRGKEQASLVAQMVESACQFRTCGFDPWVRKFPWRRKWQPTPVFLPGKSRGLQSLGSQRAGHDWVTNTHTQERKNGTLIFHHVFIEHPKQWRATHSKCPSSQSQSFKTSMRRRSQVPQNFSWRHLKYTDNMRNLVVPQMVRISFLLWRADNPQLRNLRSVGKKWDYWDRGHRIYKSFVHIFISSKIAQQMISIISIFLCSNQ